MTLILEFVDARMKMEEGVSCKGGTLDKFRGWEG